MQRVEQTTESSLKPATQRAHRALCVQMLYAIDRSDYSIDPVSIAEKFSKNYGIEISPEDFSLKLVDAVLSNNPTLELLIEESSKNWTVDRIGCLTKIILKIAMAEIICNINPAPIAIDQAVELAKDFCEKDAHKFVNGILDNFAKKNKYTNTK